MASRSSQPFRNASAEPKLGTLIAEPLTLSLMKADGVDRDSLLAVIEAATQKLRSADKHDGPSDRRERSPRNDKRYRPGVGIVLLNSRNKIFVGRRRDVKGNAWQLPQGGIDGDETPRQAALRELKEEIGTDRVDVIAESDEWLYYDLPPKIAKKAWSGRWQGQRQKWFVMRLTGPETTIDIATRHPEFDRWRWITLRELPSLAISFKRQLYLSLVGEFRELIDLAADA